MPLAEMLPCQRLKLLLFVCPCCRCRRCIHVHYLFWDEDQQLPPSPGLILQYTAESASSFGGDAATSAAVAAALGTEVVLASKRIAGIASAAGKACDDVQERADSTWQQCRAWVGDRLAAGEHWGVDKQYMPPASLSPS